MTKIKTWGEFTDALAVAKADGRNRGIQVPAIITLIYAGAFDGLAGIEQPDLAKYAQMTDELRLALNSEAKPPKAKKGDIIGLDDIVATNDDSLLHLWRWTVNPLYEFDLLDRVRGLAEQAKFNYGRVLPDPFVAYSFIFHYKRNHEVYLTDHWSSIFDSPAMMKKFNYDAALAVPMIITETAPKTYGPEGEKKERWTFKGYTGHEFTDEIVLWPDLATTVSDARRAMVAVKKVGIAIVKLSVFNGRRGASLIKWLPITSVGRLG